MAEVLLARLLGPSGFERAVVLKRVLPHLARQRAFIDMFFDEARLIARIRHPNVVQVQELVREDDELFLVMEYLEGESVSSLLRRVVARGERLDPLIAAHLVAEACAGLHAAHELRDDDGASLGIVHRDVSPQNIFVTFDGAVKILDFGIAMSHGRMTRTETGELKGKLGYMSPEHAGAKPLDRRSDVFALGIVLYELLVGRRLFQRPTPLATLKAISSEPVIPPSRIAAGCPPSLERICLRALSRDVDERYPSAFDMRREIIAAIRELSTDALPEERLAALMHEVFSDRKLEKAEMLKRVRAGSAITSLPAAEVDGAIEIPMVPSEALSQATPAARRRPKWLVPAALGAVMAAAVSAGFATRALSHDVAAAPASPPVSAPNVGAVAAPPSLSDVRIDIETSPRGAEVSIGGEHRGVTPLELRLPRAEHALAISLKKDGFAPIDESVTPNLDQKLRLTLVANPKPRVHAHTQQKRPDPTQLKW
jgi:serine/threonine-protein kinase